MTTPPRRSRAGVALVLVLMLVVLTTIVIIAFFGSIKTETNSTRSAVGIQNSRQLADLAVQTVISQIQQATQTSSTRKPGTVSWASQPGMIRCYSNTGAEIELYKLYSAQNMTVANPTASNILSLLASDLPEGSGTSTPTGDWAVAGTGNYGVFTDLNSPVYASDGTTLEYPIMNPAAATSIAATGTSTANAVLGFDISGAPGYSAASTASPTVNNQAAMPVRWLYVLQSGTMVPGVASGTSGQVTVTGASTSNPIVGRVAFWTDDETCKVNVNTAADGTYFDSPRYASPNPKGTIATDLPPTQDSEIVVEHQMAVTPPATAEYQRYVGNPAQTRLSYVLGPTIAASGIVNKSHLLTLLSPFMQWGGSQGGSMDATLSLNSPMANPTRETPYATLDEWLFSTSLDASLSRVLSPGDTTASPAPLLTNTRLEQLRFFLSANSDAPEVNLFGQPRISMWPLYTGTLATNAIPTGTSTYISSFDQLIATASTLYGVAPAARAPSGTATVPYTYYFGRQSAASPYVDFDGGSATLAPASRPKVYTALSGGSNTNTRNQSIFVFLRNLASHNVPGYGMNFNNKYSQGEMDQILTEIFDYCRCINIDDLLAGTQYVSTGTLSGSWGSGQVTPICIPVGDLSTQYSTQGFGRFYTINEVSLDFAQGQYLTASGSKTVLTGMLFLGLNSPAMGYPYIDPYERVVIQTPGTPGVITLGVTVKGTSGTLSVFGTPSNGIAGSGRTVFSSLGWEKMTFAGGGNWNNGPAGTLLWGGGVGARPLVVNRNCGYTGSLTPKSGDDYAFCGLPLLCTGTNTGTMTVSLVPTATYGGVAGVPLEIKIYHTTAAPNDTTSNGGGDGYDGTTYDLVQDMTVLLPAFTNMPFPTNMLPRATTSTPVTDPVTGLPTGTVVWTTRFRGMNSSSTWTTTPTSTSTPSNPDLSDRFGANLGYGPGNDNNQTYAIDYGDLVQSIVVGYNGDARLVAAQHTVNDLVNTATFTSTPIKPSPAFVPHPLDGSLTAAATGPANKDGGVAMAISQWEVFCQNGGRLQAYGYSDPSKTYSGGGPTTLPTVTGTGQLVSAAAYPSGSAPTPPSEPPGSNVPATGPINPKLVGKLGAPDFTGDWDNGLGHFSDGAYINKPDEVSSQYYLTGGGYFGTSGLYYSGGGGDTDKGFASPNRTVASPVMFGSLPTGVPLGVYGGSVASPTYTPYPTTQSAVGAAVPWQTLLFRPQSGHYGGSNNGTTIEDEQILDWFWMPVVQPYAISTTLSTAGKVNMNYQIAPFSYITRATALIGVLGSEYVVAVPNAAGTTYKTDSTGTFSTYRTPVKVLESDTYTLATSDGTLHPFQYRFSQGEIFRSAAEICDIYLVPQGQSWTTWDPPGLATGTATDPETFWHANQLTGDNARERPYNGLYSRLTTKSNTYTVHVRAQALKQSGNAAPGVWVENPQLIISEYRGAVTINRYLDPQDTNIPDFMSVGTGTTSNFPVTASIGAFRWSLDNYYKYRVLETRQFLP